MRRIILFLTLPLLLASAAAGAVSQSDGETIGRAYFASQASQHDLSSSDLSDLIVTDNYATRHNGVRHVYFQQRHAGIPVFGGLFNLNISRDGEVFHVGNRFVSDLAGKANTVANALEAEDALLQAAESLGVSSSRSALVRLETLGGPQKEARFAPSGISREEIPAKLVYEPLLDGQVRLAWHLVIDQIESPDWWEMRVDAVSGEILGRSNRTVSETWPTGVRPAQTGTVFPAASRIEGNSSTRGNDPEYDVIPFGEADPLGTNEMLVTLIDPADPTASPRGWHDTNNLGGTGGATFTDTRGNNVDAKDDLANDDEDTAGMRVDGGGSYIFNDAWNPALEPDAGTNLEAAIVNLFYYNNIMHDVTYHYGFDEAAGNFQEMNYTGMGVGSDYVFADAQDGSGTDNANFGTPPDGNNPRMQMFRWTAPPTVRVNSGPLDGDYGASGAGFGAALDAAGITGDVVYANDGDDEGGAASEFDGCQAFPANSLTGKIGMIDRGACDFSLKVLNVENAGGIGAIVVNNGDCSGTPCANGTITMGSGGSGELVTVGSAMIGQADGQSFKDELNARATVNATLLKAIADRDSDFDNGVIGHEYGHGISNRLTGGPANVFCLNGSEQAGEGWSDFWTLVFSTLPTDTPTTSRGVGNYLIYEDRTGGGIRPYPYSTDILVNPLTYGNIDDQAGDPEISIPHGVGTVWMTMLWDLHWELVARYGFDEDFYTGTGGNNLFIQLVVDGMKMQTCNPTFVDARDAILAADVANNAGANECEIWRAFANRGVGTGAVDGNVNVGDETEDFTLPAQCAGTLPNYLFDDGFESGDTSRWG